MDEQPGSRNGNLPGVEYALEAVGESAGGLNSRPTYSAVGISTHTSPVCGSSEGGMASALHIDLCRQSVDRLLGP